MATANIPINNLSKSSSLKNKAEKEYVSILDSNVDLILIYANITEMNEADALVNSTGPHFEHFGGVSKAIFDAAGARLKEHCTIYSKSFGPLDYGIVCETPAFNLKNKYILHIRSPNQKANGNLIEMIYSNIFGKAFIELSLQSIALPLIGTGINGLKINTCVESFVEALIKFIHEIKTKNSKTNCKIYLVNTVPNGLDQVKITIDQKLKQFSNDNAKPNAQNNNKTEKCTICLEELQSISSIKVLNKCGHSFCTECIDEYFAKVKKSCPVCNTIYGLSMGTQPDGTMRWETINQIVPGFNTNAIQITYRIPGGIQGTNHPNPGRAYQGVHRIAYLPDTNEGRHVLSLLDKAFKNRLIFTIGRSVTTGKEDVVTWNEIHHKTRIDGGPTA
jgi:deltex-like protein